VEPSTLSETKTEPENTTTNTPAGTRTTDVDSAVSAPADGGLMDTSDKTFPTQPSEITSDISEADPDWNPEAGYAGFLYHNHPPQILYEEPVQVKTPLTPPPPPHVILTPLPIHPVPLPGFGSIRTEAKRRPHPWANNTYPTQYRKILPKPRPTPY